MGSKKISSAADPLPELVVSDDLRSDAFDGVVIVAKSIAELAHFSKFSSPLQAYDLAAALQAYADVEPKAEQGCFLVPAPGLPAGKLVFSGTGLLEMDYDDVRSFADAASAGVSRALKSGCRAPLLIVCAPGPGFPQADLVALLAALQAVYVPLEVREAVPERSSSVDRIGVYGTEKSADYLVELAKALEAGLVVSRDIGGSDPERMAPPRVAEYVQSVFAGSRVAVEVVEGHENFRREYPCFAAVDRAAAAVERHRGRVIWLTYEPEDGPVEKTLMLVGKGVCYDTGGADIKAGGIMAGMSRDKCGAADVAGIFRAISLLKPKGLKVVGAMACVRNSVGVDCYLSDEIITSRAGVRIRIGNTDAEGRMAMVDVLAHMKEKALGETRPHLHTIATLTGHAVVAYGNYSAVMDVVGPSTGYAAAVQRTGERFGDPFEVSTVRRDDWSFIKDKSGKFVDVLQCNNAPSSRTPRGHQFPAAFLARVSGLDAHMRSSAAPLSYTHLDVAGSSGPLPEPTTGSSVVALTMHYCQ